MNFIRKLYILLSRRDRHLLLILLIFSMFISIIETVGVSAIMPFIAVAGDFDRIHKNEYYEYFYKLFSFQSEVNFVVAFGIILIVFYIFRSLINIFYFYLLARFSKGRYHLIAYRLFESYMGMPYRQFIERNSGELTKTIVNEAQNLTQLISATLFIISEIFIAILIYMMLIYVNWKITLLLTVILLLNALFMTKTVSKIIKSKELNERYFKKSFMMLLQRL